MIILLSVFVLLLLLIILSFLIKKKNRAFKLKKLWISKGVPSESINVEKYGAVLCDWPSEHAHPTCGVGLLWMSG